MNHKTKETADESILFDLVTKASEGDMVAFEELYKLKSRNILYHAYSILHDFDDAQDASQEVVIVLYKKIKTLNGPKYFNTWLYSIISKTCKNIIRNKMNKKEIFDQTKFENIEEDDNDFIPEEVIQNKELRSLLIECLEELPQHRKRILHMFYFENMKYEEIAEVMDMSTSEIASNLSRGKSKLRKVIDQNSKNFDSDEKVSMAPLLVGLFYDDTHMLFSDKLVWSFQNKCKSVLTKSIASKASMMTLLKLGISTVVLTAVLSSGVVWFANSKKNNKKDPGVGYTLVNNVDNEKESSVEKQNESPVSNNNEPGREINKEEKSQQSIDGITDMTTEEIKALIVFSDGSCECGHVNPKESILKDMTFDHSLVNWSITEEDNQHLEIYRGRGTKVDKELISMIDEKKDGNYVLNYYIHDDNKDPIHLKRGFAVYSNTIYPNQFQ